MKFPASKLLTVCAALLGLGILASTATAAPATSGRAKGSLLYVQETAASSIERIDRGVYRLQLTGVSPRVSTFTDRPRRRAGSQGLGAFVRSWKATGFAADPPNAALVLDRAPASGDVALLTISHPRYDRARRTLTYRATPLRGDRDALASFARRADPVTTGELGSASLFVDDGGGGSSVVEFDIAGEATSTSVQLILNGPAAWSLSSVSAFSVTGAFPITGLYMTESALDMQLPVGSSLNASLDIPIELQGTQSPQVEVTNVSGTVTVTWPTPTGPETQTLAPGDPTTLNGLVT